MAEAILLQPFFFAAPTQGADFLVHGSVAQIYGVRFGTENSREEAR